MRTSLRARYFGGLPPEVAALTGVSFSVALGFGIVAPVVPLFAKTFQVSALQASAVISVFAFMRFISAWPAGWLVNRVGERAVLWTGLAIVAVSSALAGMSQTYGQLLVLRSLGGSGSSMFTVSAMSLLLRVVSTDQRGRAASTYQSGFLLGSLAGPAIGGLVVSQSIRAPFFFYAGTLVMASWVAYTQLPKRLGHPKHDERVSGGEPVMPLRSALRLREYWTALTLNVTTGVTVFGMRNALLPLYVVDVLRRGPAMSSTGFLISTLAQASLLRTAGSVTDLRGRKPALALGATALVAALGLAVCVESLPAYLAYMAVMGAASAFLGSGGAAVVGDIVAGRKGGPVVSLFQMTGDLGMVVGPLLAGWLLDVSGGYTLPFSINLALALTLGYLVTRTPETRSRHYARSDN